MRFEGCSDVAVRYTTRVMRKYIINVSICKSKRVAGGLSIANGEFLWIETDKSFIIWMPELNDSSRIPHLETFFS